MKFTLNGGEYYRKNLPLRSNHGMVKTDIKLLDSTLKSFIKTKVKLLFKIGIRKK